MIAGLPDDGPVLKQAGEKMTKLHDLARLGQSMWYDNVNRAVMDSGEFQALIDAGILGVTSNPTIFEKAIAGGSAYDAELQTLVGAGCTVNEIYEALTQTDIRRVADLLRPIYEQTHGVDGYVSLEVSPTLAHDTQGTIAEARRLFAAVDRPNLMIKVPSTPAGLPAVERLIADGLNINITLIFAVETYEAVAEAYLRGLEARLDAGQDIRHIASVASFFVSRVDTLVDKLLEGRPNGASLQGKIAIANSKIAYDRFRQLFSGPRWERLAAHGARVQRPLWASTSTKNPHYPDTIYVDALIGPDTINTAPPATVQAFLDHGTVAVTITAGLDEARAQIAALADMGIDLGAVTAQLQVEGVDAFVKSFESLMQSIAAKRERILAAQDRLSARLGEYQARVDETLAAMAARQVVARLWKGDHTLWKPDPKEITNRLGWLTLPQAMRAHLPEIMELAEAVRKDGYTHALLLGMGGSSLAPETFGKIFARRGEGRLELVVLDSTDPGAVLAAADRIDMSRTLFIVSTKSGGTVETNAFFKYFYNRVIELIGGERVGDHFIAITDPGSSLADMAAQYHFRKIFLADPTVGGRNSALSHFGLVPAALIGMDLERLLDRAAAVAAHTQTLAEASAPVRLGAILGGLAQTGRDKMTLVLSPEIASFGDWVEQLIAESTGKEGQGILPVVGERLGRPKAYGPDRVFVCIRLGDDTTHDAALNALAAAGHPVVDLRLRDRYDLGGQFFLWEVANAVIGHVLGINPFDQPNVESAKVQAREMLRAYQERGNLPPVEALPPKAEVLESFLAQAKPGDYIAIQAYLTPSLAADAALAALRLKLRDKYRLATTVGYGPRFLHSTGQLHKGDAGNGLFLQFTADSAEDVLIPDAAGLPESSMTFGVLKLSQALGDRRALLDAGRRIVRFHLGKDAIGALERLVEELQA